jgi:AraC-like DNA-binding protein
LDTRSVPEYHNKIELAFVLSGAQISLIGGRKYLLRTRHLDLFWGAIPHQPLRVVRPGRWVAIHFPLPWFMRCKLPAPFITRLLEGKVVLEKSPNHQVDAYLFHRWKEDLASRNPERYQTFRLELEARLRRMAENQSPEPTPELRDPMERDITVEMARFIAENFQQPITLADIAAAAQTSPDWGARLFRKAWHMSPHSFVTRHRLAEAQRLLAVTPLKIIEVALRAGFGSVSQFYAEFQKAFGYSPRQCRLMLTDGKSPAKVERHEYLPLSASNRNNKE